MAIDTTLEGLVDEALRLLEQPERQFLAIAGAPGSGKSTTADMLQARLDEIHPNAVEILPMDGFHFDDAVLNARGRRPWKGAPDTFDVGGLVSVIQRLRANEDAVAVPVFDRALEISRGSARLIGQDTKLIIVEGNYLLLDRAPWTQLATLFDVTVIVDVPPEVLAERLRARWVSYDLSDDQIREKLQSNDLPNGATVRNESRSADFTLHQ
ncbi:nucleoside triphosphate hydrolase [Pacificibacter marinus]|uniref:Pantothenate kinase n=1 Tax=Pacificibacter marinus TaxID=658057 RepID=A0A1Y5TCR1_9RHOB|nr:nucleoside triphosphate hydrolase [Pacificibacter marinus]SEL07911.1 Panthothenate kinase [Pacificibacter marinus]SLN57504.1 Pantothenate kinase [Pacificibacter marinus]